MRVCTKCVLPETFPGISFNDEGVCNFCLGYKKKVNQQDEFKLEEEAIKEALDQFRNRRGKYDVLVPVSGGVDSSAALINIVKKYHLRPLVFHNDHGYEDEIATSNVKKLCKSLDVDLFVWQHDVGFMKKMWKYVNESKVEGLSACYFCGNILYINALELADRFGIRLVVNGYSKGQIALTSNYQEDNSAITKLISYIQDVGDEAFLEVLMDKFNIVTKQYFIDQPKQLSDPMPEGKIAVLPFYLFKENKTDKETLKAFCKQYFGWEQMASTYPKRTTNCQMIWLNTYFDLQKMNYTVYHEEYSELIRAGEITRKQAEDDLAFEPPVQLLEKLVEDIGATLHPDEKVMVTSKKREDDLSIDFDF